MTVHVVGRGVKSPAGVSVGAAFDALGRGVPCLQVEDVLGPVGRVAPGVEAELAQYRGSRRGRTHDRAVALGVLAARAAWAEAGGVVTGGLRLLGAAPTATLASTAVVMGSSRGATETLEYEHDQYLGDRKVSVTTSPATTAGTFAAAVSQDLGAGGLALFVSSACSTSLNAVGTAVALLESGMATHALAGGAEASLTGFTLAQLRAARVAARAPSVLFPCKPLHPQRGGLIPGEGAACVALATELEPGQRSYGRVLGFGAATEAATATGISVGGDALVRAVRQALERAGLGPGDVDLVVGHGAGTVKGDDAELAAYRTLFERALPPVTFHKWLTGHMLGAASGFSLALATEHLARGEVPALPYHEKDMPAGNGETLRLPLRHVLVTALGFGGGAAALILGKP